MSLRNRLFAASCTALLGLAPSVSYSQSLGDLLKLVPQSASTSNILGIIQSVTEVTQGQALPGMAPQNVEGKVVLYRTASCGYCKRAAAHMQSKNIDFVERDIERNSGYKAEFKRLGGKGVPLMVYNEKTMSGFEESAFDRYYANARRTAEGASGPLGVTAAASTSSTGNRGIQSGDVLVGKISGIQVYAQPAKREKLTALGKTEEVIYMGEERDGFYRVTTQKGEGWIDKLLVKKQ